MISYTEKGYGLHEAIRAAGHWLREENGVFVSSDDQAVQAIIDAYDPVADHRTAKIAEVKAEAQQRIYAVVPAWKQTNLLAQAALLNDKGRGRWSAQELAAWNAGQALWAQVASIRAASDQIEADIAAMTDWQEINAFDVAASARWPE